MFRVCLIQLARLSSLTLAMVAALVAPLTGSAHAQSRHAAMAIDANTGEVLYAQSADEPRFPASLTKMMTLYIAFGEIQAGRLSFDTRIQISERAAAVPPSKLDLEPGAEIALIDAMKSLVTKSANDVAVAIAERIAGSEEAFARLMTQRARQIGMRSTTFRNAHGLPDASQVTTARDMLTLALRLHDDHPKLFRLFSLKYFTYRGDNHRNHNSLLFHYAGTEGIKTGYTRASGFNLVTSVKRDGKHVVAAVFGGATAGTRNAHMRNMLGRVLAKASPNKTRKSAPLLIAQPKPAPRPAQVALKAEPKPAPRPPKPAAIAPATAKLPMPTAVTPAPAPPEAVVPTIMPERPAPPVEIAMVKVRPSTPPPAPAAGPVVASLATKLDYKAIHASLNGPREAAPAPTAPPAATETIITKAAALAAPVRAPGTLEQQMAVMTDIAAPAATPTAVIPPPPAPAVVRPRPAAAPAVAAAQPRPARTMLGSPPSTLGAQAARLGTAPATAAARAPQRLGGPATSAADYEIQIGTFASAADAEGRLNAVQRQTAILSGHAAMALPAQDGGRMIYRARFAGFDAQRASNACTELRRTGVDCFVAKPE